MAPLTRHCKRLALVAAEEGGGHIYGASIGGRRLSIKMETALKTMCRQQWCSEVL